MIEIASAAMPQLGSLFRWSFDRAAGARLNILQPPLPSRAAAKKIIPWPAENTLATLYPSKSSLTVIPTTRQRTPATLKSP